MRLAPLTGGRAAGAIHRSGCTLDFLQQSNRKAAKDTAVFANTTTPKRSRRSFLAASSSGRIGHRDGQVLLALATVMPGRESQSLSVCSATGLRTLRAGAGSSTPRT